LFHIVKNHPFSDGNKRTAAVAGFVFLFLNGIEVNAVEKEFEKMVFAAAASKVSKKEIADFFRRNSNS
jgi:death-on-curing protein